jgi:hypothetical protein
MLQTGKTVFLSYVLVRRLQQRLDTIYCDRTGFAHVFTGNGVRRVDLGTNSRIHDLDSNSNCCALVNLGDQMVHAPAHFYPITRRGRVVIATSPNPEHLVTFSKEHEASTYCMPTWSWEDLYCSRSVPDRNISPS